MFWVYLGAAIGLGAAAAWWLRRRAYRHGDDVVVRRELSPWWVPVVAGLGTVLAAPFFAGRPPLVVFTYVIALVWGVTLMLIDLEVRLLPDRLTLPAYGVVTLLLVGCSAVTGDWSRLLIAAASAGAALLVFLLAALVGADSSGLGLGDVKLAGVLGALLGWWGWFNAVAGLLGGFILGGLVAAVLLISRRVDRRSHIAFGPAMIISAYVWCVLSPTI